MSLEASRYEHYWDRGWTVAEGVFTPQEAGRIAQLAHEVSQREFDESAGSYQTDRSDDGEASHRKIDHPFIKHEDFAGFMLDKRLVSLIEGLIGLRPLPLTDQIFMKPPRFGSAKPYHQDNFYFQCFPDDHVLTAWIALDDVDEHNSCLRYIDGSHLGPILRHKVMPGEPYNHTPSPDLVDLSRESVVVVKKGVVVFHHSKTLHSSHRNGSDLWRRGYATHWVTADVTCDKETLDKAYYKTDLYRALTGSAV